MKKNLELLGEKGMPLTPRELSILSIAITILQQRGLDPLTQPMICQVDQTSASGLNKFPIDELNSDSCLFLLTLKILFLLFLV